MNPLFIAAFVLALLACVLLIVWIHAMDRAEEAERALKSWKPTRRQLAQWKRERLQQPTWNRWRA